MYYLTSHQALEFILGWLTEVMNSTNVSNFLQDEVFNRGQYFAAMMEMIFPLLIGKSKNIEQTIQAVMHTHLKAPKCKLDENGFAKVK